MSRVLPERIVEVEGPLGKLHVLPWWQNASKRGQGVREADVPRSQPGKLSMPIPAYMQYTHDVEARKLALEVQDRTQREQRAMWGMSSSPSSSSFLSSHPNPQFASPPTPLPNQLPLIFTSSTGTVRAVLASHVLGVSEGHVALLRLIGVGYRASIEPSAITKTPAYPGQQFVALKLGYSHPIELGIPPGVKASTPQPTRILLEGADKAVVKQFAAEIRMWRKPEPYKGKGIFVDDETIRLKAKKIK